MEGAEIVRILRDKLKEENEYIINHPVIKKAIKGELPKDSIKKFVVNQLYIVPHDLRSLAKLLSRAKYDDEVEFFRVCIEGDYTAHKELIKLASELNIDPNNTDELLKYLSPKAVAYTHYLAWLANYASLGEAAIALVINLPVWGNNVGRLGEALREKYGIKEVGFFKIFSQPYDELERLAYPIIERYEDLRRYELIVRLIQSYERMFWDSLLE